MKSGTLKKVVLAAMFSAFCCVATLVITIPTASGGYVNLGDGAVLLSGFALGPLWGAVAAGIGSALADLIAGYAMYVPATLIIKALTACTAALLLGALKKRPALGCIVGGVAGESLMTIGYYAFAALFLNSGIGAAATLPGNLMQGAAGIAISTPLWLLLRNKLGKEQ